MLFQLSVAMWQATLIFRASNNDNIYFTTNPQCGQGLAWVVYPCSTQNQLGHLKAGGWNHPKAHLLTGQVVNADSWLGHPPGQWLEHLEVAFPRDCLASSQHGSCEEFLGSWVPRVWVGGASHERARESQMEAITLRSHSMSLLSVSEV